MIGLIKEVVVKVVYSDGLVFERCTDWQGGGADFDELRRHSVRLKQYPAIKVENFIVCESGERVFLPVYETLHILPDRTGVLVIFDRTPSKFCSGQAPWFFGYPHNAAIYNADGSLRFQLKNPAGESSYIGGVHTGAIPDKPNALGVLVGDVEHEPEWLYMVDFDNPELKKTGKWIRY